MTIRTIAALVLLMCGGFVCSPPAAAQPVMENLGRSVVAVRSAEASVYIGWRLLATDPADVGFNLYRAAGAGNRSGSIQPCSRKAPTSSTRRSIPHSSTPTGLPAAVLDERPPP